MTRADFYDWLISQGCKIEPLPVNTRGNIIKIVSPRSKSYVYYNGSQLAVSSGIRSTQLSITDEVN